MDKVFITILISASLSAALIWIGPACCSGLADSIGYSRFSRMARRFSPRRLLTLVRGLKMESLIGRLNVRELTNRLRLSPAACRFTAFIHSVRSVLVGQADSASSFDGPAQPDMAGLNCRVCFGPGGKDASIGDSFVVEICGTIHSHGDNDEAALKVTLSDVTGAPRNSEPVLSKAGQWRLNDSNAFCYSADLGRLAGRDTVLHNWMRVARLQTGWLLFPRRGERNLLVRVSIVSCRDSQELAHAECVFPYYNEEFGYIDVDENRQRVKTLAIALAFTVSAADGKMFKCEVDLIKDWARDNLCLSEASSRARRKLEKALSKTLTFFSRGYQLNTQGICRELVELASPADVQDVIALCLHVAQAKGSVAPEELAILGDLARWLQIDADVYRSMMERILPVNMHQVKDTQLVLGVTSDMSEDAARQLLNREYSKWNSRVTNRNPQIQAQADEMLSLIAEARREYVG